MTREKVSVAEAMEWTGRTNAPLLLIPFVIAVLIGLRWIRALLRR